MGKLIKGPWSVVDEDSDDLILPTDEIEYVAFDVETTGFNKTDRIVEIGFVVFKNGHVLEEWTSMQSKLRVRPHCVPLINP